MSEHPIYDRLKAEGLGPPESVKLLATRPLTDREREFGATLERMLTEHADVWQALADLDAKKGERG
jgi:hypothetical protein